MAKYAAIIFVFLAGCSASDPNAPRVVPAAWDTAPMDYVCTAEQSAKVERETRFCNDNTSYFSTYCYGSAIMRNCTIKRANQ